MSSDSYRRHCLVTFFGVVAALSACERRPPVTTEMTAEVTSEATPLLSPSPPAWIDVPSPEQDILGVAELLAPFASTNHCFADPSRRFVCLGRVERERPNSKGEMRPYLHEVPGFVVGDREKLHYVPVPRMGFVNGARHLGFDEPSLETDAPPVLIVAENEAGARIECGDEVFEFEKVSEDEASRLFEAARLRVTPPVTEVGGGRLDDGTLVVLWSARMPNLPRQRILAMGQPPRLDILEIVASRTENGAVELTLAGEGRLDLEAKHGGGRLVPSEGEEAKNIRPLSDKQWQEFLSAIVTPPLVHYGSVESRGACSVLGGDGL